LPLRYCISLPDSIQELAIDLEPWGIDRLLNADWKGWTRVLQLPALRQLECTIGTDDAKAKIAALSTSPASRGLTGFLAHFSDSDGQRSIEELLPLTTCPNLRSLTLRGNRWLELQPTLCLFTSLTELSIPRCRVPEDSIQVLVSSLTTTLTQLRTLSLDVADIGDGGSQWDFRPLSSLTQLTSLHCIVFSSRPFIPPEMPPTCTVSVVVNKTT
jgi:hypothetical protein